VPLGTRFSAPIQTGPEAHPAFYTVGTMSFPGEKWPGHGVDHPPPYSKDKVISGVAQGVGRGIALLFHDHGTRRTPI